MRKGLKEEANCWDDRDSLLQRALGPPLDSIEGCISTGKEANVYYASKAHEDGSTESLAIKVYKTSILVFKVRHWQKHKTNALSSTSPPLVELAGPRQVRLWGIPFPQRLRQTQSPQNGQGKISVMNGLMTAPKLVTFLHAHIAITPRPGQKRSFATWRA